MCKGRGVVWEGGGLFHPLERREVYTALVWQVTGKKWLKPQQWGYKYFGNSREARDAVLKRSAESGNGETWFAIVSARFPDEGAHFYVKNGQTGVPPKEVMRVHDWFSKGNVLSEYPDRSKAASKSELPVSETTPESTEKEDNLHLSSTLTVPRQTLIDKIKKSIEAAKASWQKTQDEAKAANAAQLAFVTSLSDELLFAIVKRFYATNWTDWGTASDEEKEARIRKNLVGNGYLDSTTPTFVAPENATKLLSVLEAASDENLQVSADDDLYKYL